jgi:hypothetical protein
MSALALMGLSWWRVVCRSGRRVWHKVSSGALGPDVLILPRLRWLRIWLHEEARRSVPAKIGTEELLRSTAREVPSAQTESGAAGGNARFVGGHRLALLVTTLA